GLAGLLLELAEARLDVARLRIVDDVVRLDLGLELIDPAAQPLQVAERAAGAAEVLARRLARAEHLRGERALARLEVLELALDLLERVLHLPRGLLLLGGLARPVLRPAARSDEHTSEL